MIEPSRAQFPTTAMIHARMAAREALAAESRPPYNMVGHTIECTNPEASDGMRNYIVRLLPADVDSPVQVFDGRAWINRPD